MSNDMFDHMMHDSPESPADSATIASAIRREKGLTMTKTTPQPTPGPWTAHHDPDRGTFTVVDANGFGVAMHILDEANAHLIANAPRVAQEHAEMVNLIRWHLLPLIEQAYGKEHPCGDPARAALARIKGE